MRTVIDQSAALRVCASEKISSMTRGMMPRSSALPDCLWYPIMVAVLPLPLWPYAMIVQL